MNVMYVVKVLLGSFVCVLIAEIIWRNLKNKRKEMLEQSNSEIDIEEKEVE